MPAADPTGKAATFHSSLPPPPPLAQSHPPPPGSAFEYDPLKPDAAPANARSDGFKPILPPIPAASAAASAAIPAPVQVNYIASAASVDNPEGPHSSMTADASKQRGGQHDAVPLPPPPPPPSLGNGAGQLQSASNEPQRDHGAAARPVDTKVDIDEQITLRQSQADEDMELD